MRKLREQNGRAPGPSEVCPVPATIIAAAVAAGTDAVVERHRAGVRQGRVVLRALVDARAGDVGVARVDPRTAVRAGEKVVVDVDVDDEDDVERVHLLDADSSRALPTSL